MRELGKVRKLQSTEFIDLLFLKNYMFYDSLKGLAL